MRALAEKRDALLSKLEQEVFDGYRFPWRVAESPGLITSEVLQEDLRHMKQLLSPYLKQDFHTHYQDLVPAPFKRPDDHGWFPQFLATDFQRSVDSNTDEFVYGVPEIQSFPSNFLLKPLMVRSAMEGREDFREENLIPSSEFDSYESFVGGFGSRILGTCRPEETAILEIDPMAQKTVVDQLLYLKHFGIRLVDLRDLWVDESTGEALYLHAVVWEDAQPRARKFDRPQVLRRAVCRALPEEIEEDTSKGRLEWATLGALFQGTLERGTCEWVVHPQDFFVVWKGTLVGNPHHSHPLIPVDDQIMDRIKQLGLRPEDGVMKPASRAGGEGLVGFDGLVTESTLMNVLEQRRKIGALSLADGARMQILWQPRYPASVIPVPDSGSRQEERFQEIRLMWMSHTDDSGAVSLQLLAGMTRWAKVGRPANARFATMAFTGTHGVLFPAQTDARI
jgi:hypothetical protein